MNQDQKAPPGFIPFCYERSFRLVRPVKLEFSRQDNVLIVKLSSYVRPWFLPFWRFFFGRQDLKTSLSISIRGRPS